MPKLSKAEGLAMQPGTVLKDHVLAGLELHRGKEGWSWKLYHRGKDGVQRRPKICAFPAIPLEAARAIAKEWLERAARGDYAGDERKTARRGGTLKEVCEGYLENHVKPRRGASTHAEYKRHMENHVYSTLGTRKMAAITQPDIARLLARIGAKHPVASNRVHAVLHALFRYAEKQNVKEREPNTNPVTGIEKYTERPRTRHIQPEEWVRIAAAMREEAERVPGRDGLTPLRCVSAIKVMLLAGTRVTELVTAKRWQRQGNRITLQEHKSMRKGVDRVLILPQEAVAILDAIPDDNSGFIFGAGVTRYAVFNVWERIREAAGCPDLQVRDLRRSYASVGLNTYSLDAIGQMLGHSDPKTTRGYAWLMADTGAAIANTIGDDIKKRLGS